MMMIKFGESGHPVFRSTSPLSRGTLKSEGGGKLTIHFSADGNTIETVFRTIISVNHLSIYGAVSDLFDKYRICQARTVRPVLAGQSDPGFLTTVEVGQFFTTKDTDEFSQFPESVACREYTLPRDENLSEQKVGFRGNTNMGPVLEVTTCCLQGINTTPKMTREYSENICENGFGKRVG